MNRSRLVAIARSALLVWGGISLCGVIAIGIILMHELGRSFYPPKKDSASRQDVRFVLNWCGLGDWRIEKVVHSYVSNRSFNGDHLDAYAIKISQVETAELTADNHALHPRWFRGDQLPPVLSDAVTLAGRWSEIPWFPNEDALKKADYYVCPWSIRCHGIEPDAVELIFVRPSDKMVFYLGCSM